jgi:hypothetical protein
VGLCPLVRVPCSELDGEVTGIDSLIVSGPVAEGDVGFSELEPSVRVSEAGSEGLAELLDPEGGSDGEMEEIGPDVGGKGGSDSLGFPVTPDGVVVVILELSGVPVIVSVVVVTLCVREADAGLVRVSFRVRVRVRVLVFTPELSGVVGVPVLEPGRG